MCTEPHNVSISTYYSVPCAGVPPFFNLEIASPCLPCLSNGGVDCVVQLVYKPARYGVHTMYGVHTVYSTCYINALVDQLVSQV